MFSLPLKGKLHLVSTLSLPAVGIFATVVALPLHRKSAFFEPLSFSLAVLLGPQTRLLGGY
jgi:hypothetical protein